MLGADDPLDPVPRRVLVAGTTGVGKTTTAGRIGRVLGLPHTEIDSLYHGAGWVPRDTFVADVERYTSEPAWVTEWQYTSVRAMLANRADTLVWIDLPTAQALWRLLRRTLHRRFGRIEMWNGNVEPSLWTFFTDRGHILRWGISTRNVTRRRVPELVEIAPHLRIVHLRSQREVDRFVQHLGEGRG
ncbi:AAA family ATPase [Curtobacterium sp. MCBA15_016]|uniref:AAA family ATPase n=1 Tax=Curtobacterium sp. MCBA15_016 TaxID=1898740 RepID=UPI0008DD5A9F|nr:AAA family ATPase [Curtobacterium sp. MCBA15_016]OII21034.1 AAA family ATPase [Curtobacterium sp. MCBA15_016]